LAIRSYGRLFALYDKITKEAPEDDTKLDPLRTEIVNTLKAFIAEFRKTTDGRIDPRLAAVAAGPVTTSTDAVTAEDGKFTIPFRVQGPQPPAQEFTLVLEAQEGETPTANLQAEQGEVLATIAKPMPVECLQDNIPDRRGFQILGPEGWRTFDQDERLLLAMSADAQPLIGTMKELSQRLIQSRAPALAFQRVLPVERLRVANTKQALDSPAPDATPVTLLDRTIQTFNTEAGGS